MRRPLPARFTGHPRMSSGYGYVFTRLAKSEARSIRTSENLPLITHPKLRKRCVSIWRIKGRAQRAFKGTRELLAVEGSMRISMHMSGVSGNRTSLSEIVF
jgi:hypothetical protein